MQNYDAALKVLLQASTDSVRQLTGANVTRWLNVEISQVLSSRMDLLGATADDSLVHIELQSTNDPDMALRMAEYSLRIYRQFKKFPRQIVLYVGEPKLRMKAQLSGPDSTFQYTLIDARELDGDQLLASSRIEDNLMAILARLENRTVTVRTILERIASLEEPERRDALAKLLVISGIRTLEETIKEEALKMPILNDIMDNKVFGPVIRQSRQEGLQEGRQAMLRRQLEKRFGPIPEWVEKRLAGLPTDDLDEVGVRLLDASSFEDLFPQNQ
jgi:predicted transposase YdaD